jgi:hypothetical protein
MEESMERVYYTFNYPNAELNSTTVLTGIKHSKINHKKYYITGIYISSLPDVAFIYKGDLKGKGIFHILSFSNKITNLFGPINEKKDDIIQVVGTFTVNKGIVKNNMRIATLYKGPLDGSGRWIKLIPPSKEEVIDIVAHSTMCGLVVGNFRIKSLEWKSYIYEIKTRKFFDITNMNAKNIVTYGVWHVSTCWYVICGSYTIPNTNIEMAYLVNWDNKNRRLYNWRAYSYGNDSLVTSTRFNSITSCNNKHYKLTGFYIKNQKESGFLANVKRSDDGDFSGGHWQNIFYPDSQSSAGNGIDKNVIVGIYDNKNGFVSL